MNRKNLGEKYTRRITLRLTEEQFQTVVKLADILGVLPAEFLRMTVNTYVHATSTLDFQARFGTNAKTIEGEEKNVNEYVKANQHDIV